GRNPLTINSLINNAVGNVTRDKSFSTRDLFRLGKRFRSLEPDAVEMLSLPAVNARINGAAVLRLKQPEATDVINHFLGRVPPAVPGGPAVSPSTVRVRVLNGSGSDGQASDAAAELQTGNFNVAGTGDADSFRYVDPVIRYGRGQQAKAQLLKTYVAGAAQLREDPTIRGVDLVLITGSSFGGIRPPTAGPPPGAPPLKPGAEAPTPKGGPAQPQC
ncbi:MAG TPA: LytR C-terminal domain-containing protein, partial [bacterium]|nr:LytR C-terminal domain-containing protein [bacterium]